MQIEIKITDQPLEVGLVVEKTIVPESGGIDVFIGTVRNQTKGKTVVHLEYESYIPMAEKEIDEIAKEAFSKWGLVKVIVHHRIGILQVMEKAVVISVSAAHRDEAFHGCRYIIEEVKKRAPIWKKEFFEDGEEWVSAHP